MWNQQLFELFTTMIPQAFIVILLFFTLTDIKIEKKSYILFSIILAFLTFLIRPYVNFGVHSVIMLFTLIVIAVKWGKVNIISSVIYGIVTFIVAYFCEWITFFVLEITKFDMNQLNTNSQIRAIVGFIPLCIFLSVSLIIYYIKSKLKEKKVN